MTDSRLNDVLEKIYQCGKKGNRPECCGAIVDDQKTAASDWGRDLIGGFTPSPILGDINAPILIVATNPKLRDDDLTYDELSSKESGEAIDNFIEYSTRKHRRIPESDYQSRTSKMRIGFLRELGRRLGGTGMEEFSIRNGAAICTNVVQCPSTNWKQITKARQKEQIESVCSMKHLLRILEFVTPKVVIAEGGAAYRWMKAQFMNWEEVSECTIDWSKGVKDNDEHYIRIGNNGNEIFMLVRPYQYMPIKRYEPFERLIREGLLTLGDFTN